MLVTSLLIIVIQTKCITMLANNIDYFDHAATIPGVGQETTLEELPLPNLTPWITLFPTPTPKPNTTAKITTKEFVTKFFYVVDSNFSDIFTVTERTVAKTISPYLTGFVTTPSHKVTFPLFIIKTTMLPSSTDIFIPTLIADNYKINKHTTISYGDIFPAPLPKEFDKVPPPLPKKVDIVPPPLPKKVDIVPPPLPKKVDIVPPPLPKKVDIVPPRLRKKVDIVPPRLPKKVDIVPPPLPKKVDIVPPPLPKKVDIVPPPLPKKVGIVPPPLRKKVDIVPPPLPKKVDIVPPPFPKKVDPPLRQKVDIVPPPLPKKVDGSGLNNSTTTTTTKPLSVSPTNETNTTNPSVTVSTTVKLQANTSTSPNNNSLTTNNVTTDNATITNPGLNKPAVTQNATNVTKPKTSNLLFESVERQPIPEGPTTTVVYEDVIEYEELTTEPFSKFLEQLMYQLAKMNIKYATLFIRNFDRIATSKSNAGAFHNFGGITIRYIEDMLPGLETSTDILQRMFALGYANLKSRRKTMAVDTNELLDYMDMMFTPSEEKLMQEKLNDIMRYPNISKSAADICTEMINDFIVMPSKRLSGTKKGIVLFKSLDNVIVSRHPEYDHYRRDLENKEAIAAINNQVGKSNRRNIDSFHYSNGRKFKALNHNSDSNRRYDGSIKNAKGKKSKAMHHLNKGNARKWIHVNEGDRKRYTRPNNALRREIERTNHGTESNRRNYGSIHNDKRRDMEVRNPINGDKRKYDSVKYSIGRKGRTIRNFNNATREKNGSIIIAINKGIKAINQSNRKKYKKARKKLHDRRFGKQNLRRSYNTFTGRYQTTGWISNARERDKNQYNSETDNVYGSFSDSDTFVQSESDDEDDEIERQNLVFDRYQKIKSKNVIEPVMKIGTVTRQGSKKIKWGLPSWDPDENQFAVLQRGHHPSQRRTDRQNYLLNNRENLLKNGFPNNKNRFEMFREGRPLSEPQKNRKNKNNNNILRLGPKYDNVNFSAPMKSQFQNNIRPVKKSFSSRQLKMLQITKRFHNYKPKMEENGEPSPNLNPMDKPLINRTSNKFATERYTEITHTYFELTPQEILNNNSNNPRNSYNERNKNIGRLNVANDHANQQVMSVNYDDNSPGIIDFSMKVKLKNHQDARNQRDLVFVNDHNKNQVNMRGKEAQVTEETRTWDPYQMDKYFGKTKVTRRVNKKRVYVRKSDSDTSENSDSDVSQDERDVEDEESEQDESDRYKFKEANRKAHSKHHHKHRVKRHKRKNHDKHRHKKHRRDVKLRHGTHKKNRKKHGFRPNTKKRKRSRNKHSHRKNHRHYKNKRGKKTHLRKHAMAIDPIRNRASDTRPISAGNLFKYENEESSSSAEYSSNSTEQTVGISAPENKVYKPIGKLMEFGKDSTLKSNNEIETYKQPSKLNYPEITGSGAQAKNSQEVKDLEDKLKEDNNNEGKVNKRNPKRRGGYVTIGLLMDDMIYRFRENELKRNVYDAFRQNYRRNYRRTLGYEFHAPVLPPLVIREDSVYTDDEAVLKRNIYKAIKSQNADADVLDQNTPKVLKRTF